MRYCPKCDEEYREGSPLLARADYEAELARQGRQPLDIHRFAEVATFSDRFEADELAHDLQDEGFDVALVTSSRGSTVGPITTAAPQTWALVVPESEAGRARPLVAEWRAALEASRPQAEAAADLAEAASEVPAT
jgi:hypothetical protein